MGRFRYTRGMQGDSSFFKLRCRFTCRGLVHSGFVWLRTASVLSMSGLIAGVLLVGLAARGARGDSSPRASKSAGSGSPSAAEGRPASSSAQAAVKPASSQEMTPATFFAQLFDADLARVQGTSTLVDDVELARKNRSSGADVDLVPRHARVESSASGRPVFGERVRSGCDQRSALAAGRRGSDSGRGDRGSIARGFCGLVRGCERR